MQVVDGADDAAPQRRGVRRVTESFQKLYSIRRHATTAETKKTDVDAFFSLPVFAKRRATTAQHIEWS